MIVRSPLRIALGGGGTDLPSYYEKHGGSFISAAINQYVYASLQPRLLPGYLVRHDSVQTAENISELNHPIIREVLTAMEVSSPLEITTFSDVPAGTGLGGSGSLTTALIEAISYLRHQRLSTHDLAELACHIEIDRLKAPVGKQDQFISAYGGVTSFEIDPTGTVRASRLKLKDETIWQLENNLLLFFTGITRSASKVLKEQDDSSRQNNERMLANLTFIKKIGIRSKEALENNDMNEFAALMDEHWEFKRKRSESITNPEIDAWYAHAKSHGAKGGKLIGAGGGGFLMFYSPEPQKLRTAMSEIGLKELRFQIDFEGTKILSH